MGHCEIQGVLDSWNLLRQIKWTDIIDSINLVKQSVAEWLHEYTKMTQEMKWYTAVKKKKKSRPKCIIRSACEVKKASCWIMHAQ